MGMRRGAGADGVPKRPYARVKAVHVCGFRRQNVVCALGVLSLYTLYRTSALATVAWAVGAFASLVAAHASARSPNLKAALFLPRRVQGGMAGIRGRVRKRRVSRSRVVAVGGVWWARTRRIEVAREPAHTSHSRPHITHIMTHT